MSLDRPLWLAALPPLIVAFLLAQRFGLTGLGARRRRVTLGIRIALTLVIVLALAGLRLGGGGDRLAVVFLVDRSDSVGTAGIDRALDIVSEAVRAKRPGDLVAVVAFGKEPRLEFGMTERPNVDRLGAVPDASATDLARALRLAAALFPEGTKRRIVVLSDARETRGDARREAARLSRAGIVIEGFTIGAPASDTLVEALDVPARARRGEAYPVAVTVRSSAGGPAHLELFRDGTAILSRDVTLNAGRTTIAVSEHAAAPGVHRYEARIAAALDAVPQNNRASAAVIVEGPPRVLVVEGEPGEADALGAALSAAQIVVQRVSPRDVPGLADLLSFNATVLADVPADALSADQIGALRTAIQEAGAGLVTIGGEDSYGLGGYRGSELESLLPVDSDIKDPKRRPSVAEAIVVDTSGSMGRCHCRGGAQGGPGMQEGGINKTDISRAGASRAVRALSADDTVGVLAFNTESRWVIPLQKLPSAEVVEHGLAGLTAAGGTNIPQALRTAVAELRQTKAKLKHIILFTDGWTNQEELVGVAKEVSAAGITLSVVATGEGTGDVLSRMAESGRGRFYAGTNLADVPQVMMQEAILASRNFVNEGVFTPIVSAETPVTQPLTEAPALLGYIATTAKPTATTELEIGPNDPLLARWRAGLGSVASWTSDAKARWAKPWIGWDGYRDFWTRVVRSTFAPGAPGGFGIEARVVGDRLQIEVAGERALSPTALAVARVVDPSLRASELTLDRTGPGSFRGETVAEEEGTYLVLVTVTDGGAIVFRDSVSATLSYSPEYLAGGPDPSLIPELARATRGRTTIEPRQAFDRGRLRASSARRELWPLLAVLAAFLIPVDVAARRLVVSREDLRRGLAVVRARLRRLPFRRRPPGEREERIDRLLEAKRRTRDRFR